MTIYIRATEQKFNDTPIFFGELYDYDKSTASIIFDEFIIRQQDTNYIFAGYANQVNEFKTKADFKDSGILYFITHTEPYKQYNPSSKKDEERSVDEFEQVVKYFVDKKLLKLDTCYNGAVTFGRNTLTKTLVDGKGNDQLNEIAFNSHFNISEKESEVGINDLKVVIEEKKEFQRKPGGISELQRLKEREQFLIEKLNQSELLPRQVSSFSEWFKIYNFESGNDEKLQLSKDFIEIVAKLMIK